MFEIRLGFKLNFMRKFKKGYAMQTRSQFKKFKEYGYG